MPSFPRLICVVLWLAASASGIHAQSQKPTTNPPPKAGDPPLRAELLADEKEGPGEPAEEPEGELTLPRPSIAEPFSVGEALYNPSRVAAGVVSLLDLMRVATVTDDAPAAGDGAGLTLRESEVRGLIEMGIADARAAGEDESGPFTFADLHAAVAPLLPGTDVGALAEAYSEAYAARPDDLVPKVMMGQPIVPETPLTRVQLWLLLVDGFVGPGKGSPAARATFDARGSRELVVSAVLRSRHDFGVLQGVSASGQVWGTAKGVVPPIQSPSGWTTSELEWLLGHLPLVASQLPFDVVPARARVHKGHGGAGQQLTLEARIGGAAPVIVSQAGQRILAPKPRMLAGRQISWDATPDDLATLKAHGTVQGTFAMPVRTDGSGTVRLGYVPKKEPANGLGTKMSEIVRIGAVISLRDLVDSHYDLPVELRWVTKLMLGTRTVETPLRIEWHSRGLNLLVRNNFNVELQFGPLGRGSSDGIDQMAGSLELQPDGSYRGVVSARTHAWQFLTGLGESCPRKESDGRQQLLVTARPVSRLNENQNRSKFEIKSGLDDGGMFQLMFFPATQPSYTAKDRCQQEIWRDDTSYRIPFLPFNDTYWTRLGYPILIPKEGKLIYDDRSQTQMKVGYSSWHVEVERTDVP